MGAGDGITWPQNPTHVEALNALAQMQTAYFEEKQDRKNWGGLACDYRDALRVIAGGATFPENIARDALRRGEAVMDGWDETEELPLTSSPHMSETGMPEWTCGHGHTFKFNGKGQAWGVPTHCFEEKENGHPCLDSSVLEPANDVAERACDEWDHKFDRRPEWLSAEDVGWND